MRVGRLSSGRLAICFARVTAMHYVVRRCEGWAVEREGKGFTLFLQKKGFPLIRRRSIYKIGELRTIPYAASGGSFARPVGLALFKES